MKQMLYRLKGALADALPSYVEAHTVVPCWPFEDTGAYRVYIVMPRWSWLALGFLHLHAYAHAQDVCDVLGAEADIRFT